MLTLQPIIISVLLVLAYIVATYWWLRPRGLKAGELLVAYASEGGNAANLAKQLQQQLAEQGDKATLLTLNQLKPELLRNAQRLLVITSTHGEGEAPENGRLFSKHLKKLTNDDLASLEYAVLALGDSHYQHFCGYGLAVAEQLASKGARLLFEPITIDRLDSRALKQWQDQLLCHHVLSCTADPNTCLVQQVVHQVKLLKRTWLNPNSPGLPMYELEFDTHCLPSWQAGDIAALQIAGVEREYSIASLPEEQVLRLLVRQQLDEKNQLGLGSGFLTERLTLNQSAHFVLRSNSSFYGPSADVPMILIGNGTGLAGLRAHLKERAQLGHHKNWLIYGERSPVHDLPWQDEQQAWQEQGHLSQLDLTFSRTENCHWPKGENGSSCRCYEGYVQQVLANNSEQIKQWLAQGAVIYLCGSKQGMAQDVERQLTQLLGETTLNELIETGRFKRDVY